MALQMNFKFKRRGTRMCKLCGTPRGLVRKYGLMICRRCFRENALELGFVKNG
ncbi:MAG TPA: 30S ribosomal protein S14 [Candidatus Norongarragalinales archaeon]|jgi:small subunit ribosomal protein S29e|nr:30S ribosomal protein S14 [Candidatus Norongarragalinales archaeon]